MKIKILAKKYFRLFSEKDEENLFKMFDEKITLKDWEISVINKKNVIKANKKIFKKFKKIQVTPEQIYQDKYTIIAEIKIKLNNKVSINVLDILKFNKKYKIVSIKAYKL
tara:strand:+ start:752 stop:1081 length:330 start_codon:yes stop_codon:yes gene_type:complete